MEGSSLGAQVEFVGNYFPINYLYGGKGDISPPAPRLFTKKLAPRGLGRFWAGRLQRLSWADGGGDSWRARYPRVSLGAYPLYLRVSFRAHPLYFRVSFRAHPLYFRVSSRAHPLYPRVSFEAHLQYPRVYLGPSH
jgi:hypothetical protein